MGNKVISKVGPKLGIYETSTDAQLSASLGQLRVMEDGRKFRLCKNSTAAALAPGIGVSSPAIDGAYDDGIPIGTASVGDKTLTVTVNASAAAVVAVNDYAGGWFVVNTGSNELGHGRKIKSNTAAAKAADTTLTFYDALTDTISSGSTGAWIKNPYNNVFTDAATGRVVGVTVRDIAASTSTVPVYFWAQVSGPCPMLCTGAIVLGDDVMCTNGACAAIGGALTDNQIGTAMQTIDTGGQAGMIWLNME